MARQTRGPCPLRHCAELKDGVTAEVAQTEAECIPRKTGAIVSARQTMWPTKTVPCASVDHTLQLRALQDAIVGNASPPDLGFCRPAVGFVLLIVLRESRELGDGSRRGHAGREFVLRIALGASPRAGLLRQSVTERRGDVRSRWHSGSLASQLLGGTGRYPCLPRLASPRPSELTINFARSCWLRSRPLDWDCPAFFGFVGARARGERVAWAAALKEGRKGVPAVPGVHLRPRRGLVIAQVAFAVMLVYRKRVC